MLISSGADSGPPAPADNPSRHSSEVEQRRHDRVMHTPATVRRLIDVETADEWCADYYEHRDPALRDSIVRAHQWLVAVCARRMVRRRESLDDLVQVANIGLLKALERFDPSFGVSFHTFASATMMGELRRHYRTVWQVRMPRSLQERYILVNGAVDHLTSSYQRSPTPDEVADYLHIGVEDVIEALSIGSAMWVGSLSPSDDADGPHDSAPLAVTDKAFEHTDDHQAVMALLNTLPPVQRNVLFLSFFEEMKQADIGERLGISQVQVSRLTRRAIQTLRARQEAAATGGLTDDNDSGTSARG